MRAIQALFEATPALAPHGRPTLAALFAAALLAGCTGGGTDVEALPDLTFDADDGFTYAGPPPQTEDVQLFRINLWDNINGEDRCGGCHVENGQSPWFARRDDVNLAYQDAAPLADLSNPGLSRLVTKVAGGHNCWLESDAACADILTGWIEAWAGSAEGAIRQIALTAPPSRDPGASRVFPDDATSFSTTVYPLLSTYCSQCHAEDAGVPQSPYLGSDDVDEAYAAAQARMDLTEPSKSRLYVRLSSEFHNCWSGDCNADGAEMLAAIRALRDSIPLTEVDPTLLTSKAVRFTDGIAASGGGRHESNVIGLWEFKTGSGFTAYDTSGVDPALDLNLTGDVSWVGGWGLRFAGGRAQGSTRDSAKLADLIRATGEYAIEAWVVPGNVTQEGPARIVSYSGGDDVRNFTLGQTLYQYNWLNRNASSTANGEPDLSTDPDAELLQATLQHVVLSYDPIEGRRIYVNGEWTGDPDLMPADSLSDWDDTFALVLGNETSGRYPFAGVVRLLAVYNRALTPEQVLQNFEAGVGARFLLLFDVSEWTGIDDGYIIFEVSQFDEYSYLFDAPYFVSLSGAPIETPIPLQGLRVGLNGSEPAVGQAWIPLDTTLGGDAYDPETGQVLSGLGSTFEIQLGADRDEFFLTFERIGSAEDVHTEPALISSAPVDGEPRSDIGVRTFAEIDGTFARRTGVARSHPDIAALYGRLVQALPAQPDLDSFSASQQMAITQLAIGYCDVLVDDDALRTARFPGLDVDGPPQIALAPSERDLLLDPLLTEFVEPALLTEADDATLRTELSSLIDTLSACAPGCAADRTRGIAKATCAAVLGSASGTVY